MRRHSYTNSEQEGTERTEHTEPEGSNSCPILLVTTGRKRKE